MAPSAHDLERLREVIERGDPLPPKRDGGSGALVTGAEATPLAVPAVVELAVRRRRAEDEQDSKSTNGSVYDRLRRARPVVPHRLDPAPWTRFEPNEAAGAEIDSGLEAGPIDYAARAAIAFARAESEVAVESEDEAAPAGRAHAGLSTEQLVTARANAQAARESTRGPLNGGGASSPRLGPYHKLV